MLLPAKIIIGIPPPLPQCCTNSWCKFNKDKVGGTSTYKPGPGPPLAVLLKLKPIYQVLSHEDLLSKCLHGLTQNENESFNATIWVRVPKF